VGEAAIPGGFALGTGLLRNRDHPATVGAHSVGEAAMPGNLPWGQGFYNADPDTSSP
jgi:hypothetical protein